jgi:hypothetical protein
MRVASHCNSHWAVRLNHSYSGGRKVPGSPGSGRGLAAGFRHPGDRLVNGLVNVASATGATKGMTGPFPEQSDLHRDQRVPNRTQSEQEGNAELALKRFVGSSPIASTSDAGPQGDDREKERETT